MVKKIAIIGAGVSGLAAAWSLRETGATVTVFEKSRGVSGRAASRTRDGVRFDHGANYFKTDSETVARLVHEELPTGDLVRIEKDVWTFDAAGVLTPGDPEINAEAKWTYTTGISTLGKLLANASGAEVTHGVRIGKLEKMEKSWRLATADGDDLGSFDAVLLTPPAPQISEILKASSLPPSVSETLQGALSEARYHRQFSMILALDGELERPGDFFALVNTDRRHDIAWLSFENDKPGRVPDGQTVLVVQMSPEWSRTLFDESPDLLIEVAREKAATLLCRELPLRWADLQRWKFAHPFSKADLESLNGARSSGLFFAGDGLIGKGRVPRALETGLDASRMIRDYLRL